MMTEKSISIDCEGAAFLNLDDLTEFQGQLKSLSKTNYKRLRREIIDTGLGFPFRVWRNEGKFFIIGGHQTKRTLVQMRDLEGYYIPRIPVTWIHAKNHKQAKRRVLQDIAQYGKVERQGLYEFITDSEIDIQDLMDSFEIPEVDLDIFKAEYVDNNVPEINEEEAIDDSEKSEEEIDELDILPPKIDALTKPGSKFKIGEHVLYNGDCLNILKTMISDSLDSMVTDPPAGISFMGKEWDEDKGGSKEWTTWLSSVISEALRVLKPGAHALVWAIPRTSHWTATALEDAGFEIRDIITHLFGSGFPKSLDISKAIDKAAGAKGEIIEQRDPGVVYGISKSRVEQGARPTVTTSDGAIRAPSTDAAKQYQGWGTALKPASEHWILCRKPLSEKTVAANVLKHGTGGINIDECRIVSADQLNFAKNWDRSTISNIKGGNYNNGVAGACENKTVAPLGRFPSNLILEDDSLLGDKSRFFYCAKASKSERNLGCEGLPTKGMEIGDEWPSGNSWERRGRKPSEPRSNIHPTVKPIRLMQYLITLITPPDGTLLDCFGGSGSTLVAAHLKGFKSILIEQSTEYCDIILARAESITEKHAKEF